MKLLNKALLVLTLLSASSKAALVLEFNEIGGNQVVLSFSGQVNLGDSFDKDTETSAVDEKAQFTDLGLISIPLNLTPRGPLYLDRFEGQDLANLAEFVTGLSVEAAIGLQIESSTIVINNVLNPNTQDDGKANTQILSADPEGLLEGQILTFNTTFADSGLDSHAPNIAHDFWRVSGTEGGENLIQFRINTVPEPSTWFLMTLGSITLIGRRKRST